MCNPLAMVAITMATTVASKFAENAQANQNYQAQQQYVNQQRTYQQALATQQQQYQQQVAQQANEAYNNQVAQLQQRQQQEGVKAASDIATLDRQNLIAQGRAKAAAGEAGVSGVSLDGLLADFTRQRDASVNNIYLNRQYSQQQAYVDATGLRADAMGKPRQVQQYIPQPIADPAAPAGFGLTALSAASDALGIYGNQSSATQSAITGLFRRPSITPVP